MMDRFDTLRAFSVAARTGSFAAAGRVLGLSRDQVSKLVRELERRLKTMLFQRSTRELRLTPAGSTYLERVNSVLQALEHAEQAMRDQAQEPSGLLRVSAPLSYGVRVLSGLSAEFLRRHPGIQIELDLDDRLMATPPETSDMLVRIAAALEKNVKAERIGLVTRGLYASPRYLAARNAPLDPSDLQDHDCLHYANLVTGRQWVLNSKRRTSRIEIDARLTSNAGLALEAAARGGAGIAILPDFLVRQGASDQPLERVLPEWAAPPLTVFAVLPASGAFPSKVRSYCEFLREQIGSTGR
jgi:DNA-binding transcriptional LysR family regulator